MSADKISRRAFAGGIAALALARRTNAQGYAGLGEKADGFARVTPGKLFAFPADHGPHPEFRIEWWYLTANLVGVRVLYEVLDSPATEPVEDNKPPLKLNAGRLEFRNVHFAYRPGEPVQA